MKRLIHTTAVTALAAAIPAMAVAQNAQPQELCDVGFAKVDANGDGAIQPREVSQAAADDFAAMDTDDNGAVTQAEFMDCKTAGAGETMDETERTAADLAAVDLDADGEVTQQEFMQAGMDAYDRAMEGDEEAKDAAARMIFAPVAIAQEPVQIGPDMYAMRNRVLFVALDADQSGTVTEDEWAQSPVVRRSVRERLIDRFEQADTDASGELSEEEYSEARMEEYEAAKEDAAEADGEGAGDEAEAEADVPVVYYRYENVM